MDSKEIDSKISNADLLLIDVREVLPSYVEEAIANSKTKVIVPLVGVLPMGAFMSI